MPESNETTAPAQADPNTAQPLVSIGMPICNESRFLEQSLLSLIAQDYQNIEIIISDNASTDDSAQIGREYAERYPHITLIQCEQNIGAASNFDKVLRLATGKYFMWASGHDLWDSNLVCEYVSALEKHPQAALIYSPARWIDENGQKLDKQSGWCDTRGMVTLARFFTVFWGNMHPILGLLRSDYAKQIPRVHDCVGADLIVLEELALQGDFLHTSATSWSRREFRAEETYEKRMQRYKSKEYLLAKSFIDRRIPFLRMIIELFRVVGRGKLLLSERLVIYLALLASMPARYIAGKK